MNFNDPKFKNEIFFENKHEAFILLKLLFAINFSVVETVVVFQKLIHVCAYVLVV